ncbi:MAG: hypothetical protein ACKO7W_11940 [Elainella sp.]
MARGRRATWPTPNQADQAGVPGSQTGNNTVLDSFLDADGDGDVDIGDAMSMAGCFLNQR